jgi:predicted nucleotidyltransferase
MTKRSVDNGLIDALRSALSPVSTLRLVVLFGSRARGDARPDSDVDLAVSFGTAPSLLDLGDVVSRCESATSLRVDVVELDGLPSSKPALAYEIARDGAVDIDTEDDFWRYRARAFSLYLDQRDFQERQRALFSDRLDEGNLGRAKHA